MPQMFPMPILALTFMIMIFLVLVMTRIFWYSKESTYFCMLNQKNSKDSSSLSLFCQTW